MLDDLRFGFRRVLRAPASSFAIVAILAAGIGATGAMLSVLDALVSRPLSLPKSGRARVDLGARWPAGSAPDAAHHHWSLALIWIALMGQGVRLVSVGLAVGVPLAIGMARWIESLLHGAATTDRTALAACTVLLLGASRIRGAEDVSKNPDLTAELSCRSSGGALAKSEIEAK